MSDPDIPNNQKTSTLDEQRNQAAAQANVAGLALGGGLVGTGVLYAGATSEGGRTLIKSGTTKTVLVAQAIKTAIANSNIAKAIGSTASKLGSTVAGSAVGQAVSSAAASVSKTASETAAKIAASAAGKAASNAGKSVGKALAKIGPFIGPAFDVLNIGMNIYSDVTRPDPAGKKAYNVTGSIVAGATDLVISAMYPITIVGQIGGMVLDMFWDPFKNYYNADLRVLHTNYNDAYAQAIRKSGLDWPLEVKPNYLKLDKNDPDYDKNIKELVDLIQKYYDNNGIIQREDVLAEEALLNNLLSMRRIRTMYDVDENGEYILKDPLLSSINYQQTQEESMLMALALAVYMKRNNLIKRPVRSYLGQYLKTNAVGLIFFIFLIISSVSALAFSLKLNKMYTTIVAVVLVVVFVAVLGYSFYTKTKESYTEVKVEPAIINEILPECQAMTPEKLIEAYDNDIDKLTNAIVEAGISIESLKAPGLYPLIATVLVKKNLLTC
jgi:hypothetical protein